MVAAVAAAKNARRRTTTRRRCNARVLLVARSRLLRDLLVGELARAPGVELTTVENDLGRIRESVAATSPDWVILEVEDEGLGNEYIELFDLRPSLKMLVLADHTARAVLCIQLGELSPTKLRRALAQIHTEEWADLAR